MKENKEAFDNTMENVESSSTPENNAATDAGNDIKVTLIKCVSIVCCAAIVLFSLNGAVEKYSSTNLSIAEVMATAANGSSSNQGGDYIDNSGSDDNDAAQQGGEDDSSTNEPSGGADDSSSQGSTSNGGSSNQGGTSSGGSSNGGASDQTNKAPSTKQEVLTYFNKVINDVKPKAKSITQTNERNYQAESIDLGALGFMEGAVNSLIESNMGENKDKMGKTATTLADKNKIFPVENETWASKLTISDIKDAKLVEKNGVYTITVKIVDDALSATTEHGASHHGRAVSIVQIASIHENAGAAKALLGGLKLGYKNGVIVATVDAKTGHVTHVKYDFVWILSVSIATANFGIIQEFDIKW